jgi:hypothetical protein
MESAPHSFPRWAGVAETAKPLRKAMLHRFPYVVAFDVHPDQVLVLAIAHGKRRPLYWVLAIIRKRIFLNIGGGDLLAGHAA